MVVMVDKPTTHTTPLKDRMGTRTSTTQEPLVVMIIHPKAPTVRHSTIPLDHITRRLMGHLHLAITTTAAAVLTLDRTQHMDDHRYASYLYFQLYIVGSRWRGSVLERSLKG